MTQNIVTESQEETVESVTHPEKTIKTTTKVASPPLENTPPHKAYKTKKAIFRTYQVIWYILGIIEVLLVFRLLLRFIGANPNSGFTLLVYTLSAPFAVPFLGVVRPSIAGNTVMEWSTLIAMAVWALVAWGLIELFQLIKPVNPLEVEDAVDKTA